jgi:hypothetical protein
MFNTYEDDNLVDTVNKLRRPMSLDSSHDKGFGLGSHATRGCWSSVEMRSTQVRRQYDHGVAEVDNTALAILRIHVRMCVAQKRLSTYRKAAIVQNLQEQGNELPAGLLCFVDKDNGIPNYNE